MSAIKGVDCTSKSRRSLLMKRRSRGLKLRLLCLSEFDSVNRASSRQKDLPKSVLHVESFALLISRFLRRHRSWSSSLVARIAVHAK